MTAPIAKIFTLSDLPDEIAVFPLAGVLLLPRGQLPLNIFEPRYLEMVDDALRGLRLIGMVQPREAKGETPIGDALFSIGCVGRITNFNEMPDGRYEITLTGLARFSIMNELPRALGGYRRAHVSWDEYLSDLEPVTGITIDRDRLHTLLREYFNIEKMDCDWAAVSSVSDDNLITCLSMICPLDASEKQALLEAKCGKTRSDLFMDLLEMVTRDTSRKRPDHRACH
jgi:Lon protease-like protein